MVIILLYVLLGIIIYAACLPLLEEIEEEKTQTHVIGFQIPSDTYEEEYEEDE